jgi:D-serine deaminase-like pyridoxal phosphate-dependent protein
MDSIYRLNDPSQIFTPTLLFYKDLIRKNIDRAVATAGEPERLRPHVKTHKTREIVRMLLAAGISKHKCATIAEAEMLATAGAPDVLIAYPIVGPNCLRIARLAGKYPRTRFGVLVDHALPLHALGEAAATAGVTIDAVLDIDCGMHRTGIEAGDGAALLYQQIGQSQRLRPGGFHVYDGHNKQPALEARRDAVQSMLGRILELRSQLEKSGLPVPRIILGGTPTFPVHAGHQFDGVELSPGTFALHDANYTSHYPDLGMTPAALLLTRVVSRPTADRLTLDLGYKAVSPDPPAGQRCVLLNIHQAEAVLQNEEHLTVRTPSAGQFVPGDIVYAMPAHVCPTVALHRQALVVENGEIIDRWDIVARDRELSV